MFKAWLSKINWPVDVDDIEYVENKINYLHGSALELNAQKYVEFNKNVKECLDKRRYELDKELLEMYKNSDEQKGSK